MAFMQTSFKSGWITDLILPPPPEGKTAQEVLEFGLKLALKMCSDPELMTSLNPLIQSVVRMPDNHDKAVDHAAMCDLFSVDPNPTYAQGSPFTQFAITDKLSMLGGYYTTDLTYHSAIRQTADGMEALTNPGSGVLIYGRFSVKVAEARDPKALDAANGKAWVINFLETNDLRCNVLLSWYIKSSTEKSHRTAHAKFKDMWLQRMKDAGYPS